LAGVAESITLLNIDSMAPDFPAEGSQADNLRLTEAHTPTADDVTRPAPARAASGAMIGPYQLLQMVGEGGMGEVWLAEQKHPVRRRVALKLVKAGMDTRQVIARFQSERQAIAVMDHPAIAKVFDAGSTPEGRPYFVMEYVAGVPITTYCDAHKLTMRERLELFTQVCGGVQHAHQKAIIHRDLKPSNILITEVDGKPTPKIIDFGIAKATAQNLTAETMFTVVGTIMGTPEYMSPEQSGSTGEDIDTRTDVYSLGVILYELLVGALPIDLKQLRKLALDEVLRRLREDDAPAPSTKFRTLGPESKTAAENRRVEPATLTRILRGDLDSITLKALEKDRSRRYGSPSDLAADIKHYLNNEPVLASAPSVAYRMQKFVRRHRIGVAAGAAVAILLVTLAVSMTIQAVRIAKERDRANREAETAKRVADFLTGLFSVSDPDSARGKQITAREILDKGAHEIETGLSGEPEVQARLMATMGDVYAGLGLYDQAIHLVQQAVDTYRRVSGPNAPETLRSQRLLAWLEMRKGQYGAAEKLLRSTLDEEKRVLGPKNPDTLHTSSTLGTLYYQQGRYADAEQILANVLDLQRRTRGPDDPATLDAMHDLAVAYDGMHLYPKEEAMWRELSEARRRVLGPDHPSTLAAMGNLAYVEFREGKLAEAEKLQRQVLDTERRVLGAEHPDLLMTAGNLANTLQNERRFQEAEKLQREVLEARRKVLGPDHPDTLFSINNLAGVLAQAGRPKEAEKLYLEALSGEQRVLGENHPEIGNVLYNLATAKALQGRQWQALDYLRQAVQHGYDNIDEMGSDETLKSLRDLPEYKTLFAEVQRRSAATKSSH
jgi:eukaryotic-like serine/threonine-protein kinase